RTYLFRKLREVVSGNPSHPGLKIMSVACGPALEFLDLLKTIEGAPLPFSIEFIALDQDSLALEDARARIEPAIRDNPQVRVHFEQDNIKRLIVERGSGKNLYENADLVYTAGLFDYLSDRASNRLIHKLYSFLRPGGTLIIGNFGIYNPQRFIMEYGAEWFLIHRSEDELKRLASDLPGDPHVVVEKEPEGVNLFLNIMKPSETTS
ncbi:MAG TPA: class I SAM-dependent methyltransferase, partial [Deltaproteobacteria bacterium]|nr:class I SAM-dependent methyltransferase [Deltaproteobacteria bacterium]